MANTYSPQSLGIKAPAGGFQQGGWYGGRQYWGGTLSDPGVIHPSSNQVGAGALVSKEVNLQSDAAQGNKPGDIERYLESQRQKQAQTGVKPTASYAPSAFSGAGTGASDTGSVGLPQTQAPLNLPDVYKGLYQNSGVEDLQKQYSEMEKQFIETKGGINDNPFLSEATRVGRVAKLEELFQERTANIRGEIAQKKADIETQLNLQLKQFDINSEVAKQGLERLNTLLSMGALDNASGEDIAQLTRMTGISSGMIQNAIKQKNATNRDTQIITSTADSGVVTATIIDKQTGEIIAQNNLGAIGNQQKSGGGGSEKINEVEVINELRSDVISGKGVREVFSIYSGLLDPNQIISIYNANSPHGYAKESPEELAALGVKVPSSSATSGF